VGYSATFKDKDTLTKRKLIIPKIKHLNDYQQLNSNIIMNQIKEISKNFIFQNYSKDETED